MTSVGFGDRLIEWDVTDLNGMSTEQLRELMETSYVRFRVASERELLYPQVAEHYGNLARLAKANLIVRLHPNIESRVPGEWWCHACGRVAILNDMDWFLGDCNVPF